MKIYGPYTRKDGRQHVCIIDTDGRRHTKSYPKFLLELKLGRELKEHETTDHVDEDFTNDNPDNLQVLTLAENARKAMQKAGREKKNFVFNCPECGAQAVKSLNDVKNNRRMGRAGPFCSRECAGKHNARRRW